MPIFTQLVTNNLSLGDTQAYVMSLFPEDSPLGTAVCHLTGRPAQPIPSHRGASEVGEG